MNLNDINNIKGKRSDKHDKWKLKMKKIKEMVEDVRKKFKGTVHGNIYYSLQIVLQEMEMLNVMGASVDNQEFKDYVINVGKLAFQGGVKLVPAFLNIQNFTDYIPFSEIYNIFKDSFGALQKMKKSISLLDRWNKGFVLINKADEILEKNSVEEMDEFLKILKKNSKGGGESYWGVVYTGVVLLTKIFQKSKNLDVRKKAFVKLSEYTAFKRFKIHNNWRIRQIAAESMIILMNEEDKSIYEELKVIQTPDEILKLRKDKEKNKKVMYSLLHEGQILAIKVKLNESEAINKMIEIKEKETNKQFIKTRNDVKIEIDNQTDVLSTKIDELTRLVKEGTITFEGAIDIIQFKQVGLKDIKNFRAVKFAIDFDIQNKVSDRITGDNPQNVVDVVDKFLISDTKSYMCLFGDSGTGKTVICHYLKHHYWKKKMVDKEELKYIPLYLSLGDVSRFKKQGESHIDAKLKKLLNCTDKEINMLKSSDRNFLFLMDAYDEMGEIVNVVTENNLENDWEGSKAIFTCRTQYINKIESSESYFTELDDFENPDLDLLDIYYVTLFDEYQINGYLEKYVKTQNDDDDENDENGSKRRKKKKKKSIKMFTAQEYKDLIYSFKDLRELIKTPLVLKMIVEILPKLIESKSIFDKESNNRKDSSVEFVVNKTRIYLMFIDYWFRREGVKNAIRVVFTGKYDTRNIKNDFIKIAEDLSFSIFLSKGKKKKKDYEINVKGNIEKEKWNAFLEKGCRKCPLIKRKKDDTYCFIHKSYLEYFLATKLFRMFEEIFSQLKEEEEESEGEEEEDDEKSIKRAVTKVIGVKSDINRKFLVDCPEIMMFFSELVDLGQEKKDLYTKILLEIVKRSSKDNKDGEKMRFAAINAITTLNYGGFDFSNKKLESICIGGFYSKRLKQFLGADLSNGKFCNTSFKGSDLRGVDFHQSDIAGAKLKDCELNDIFFGEFPSLNDHESSVTSVDYSPILKRIVSCGYDKTLIVWDFEKREKIKFTSKKTIKDLRSDDFIFSVVVSPDGKLFASGGWDKKIQIYEMSTGELQRKIAVTDQIYEMKFNSDGTKLLIIGENSKSVSILNITSDVIDNVTGISEKSIMQSIDVKSNILLVGESYGVFIYNLETKEKTILAKEESEVKKSKLSLDCEVIKSKLSSDCKFALASFKNNKLKMWSVQSKSLVKEVVFSTIVNDFYLMDDNRRIICGDKNGEINVWDMTVNQFVDNIGMHTDSVTSLVVIEKKGIIISGSLDSTIKIWKVKELGLLKKTRRKKKSSILNCNQAQFYGSKGLSEDNMKLLMEKHAYTDKTAVLLACQMNNLNVLKELIQRKYDLNTSDQRGLTNLMWAAHKGNEKCVDLLLANNVNCDKLDENSDSALVMSERSGHSKISLKILNKMKDLDVGISGNKCLFWAVDNGNVQLVKKLIDEVDLNTKDEDGLSIFHIAVDKNRLEILKLLLNDFNGGELDEEIENILDVDKNNLLMSSAAKGNIEMVKYLVLDVGMNVNSVNEKKFTALMFSVSNDHTEVAKFLIENGAELNAKNDDQFVALHWASNKGNVEIVKMLLSRGADPNLQDTSLKATAIKYALESSNFLQISLLLLKAGADANSYVSPENQTALHLAVQMQKQEVAKILLDHTNKKEINLIDKDGNSALICSVYHGYSDIVRGIIGKGGSDTLNHVNKKGYSALGVATILEKKVIIEYLKNDLNAECVIPTAIKPLGSFENAQKNLENFGKELGLDDLTFDQNNTCILGIDDSYSMHLTYEPESEYLYIYSPLLDGLPKGKQNRIELFEEILSGTILGKMRGRSTGYPISVGLSKREELVLINQRLNMKTNDQYILQECAPVYVEEVERWREVVDSKNKLKIKKPSLSYSKLMVLYKPSQAFETAKNNLKALGDELGLEDLEFDQNNTCILGIDDEFSMHLTYTPETMILYIYSPLIDGLPKSPQLKIEMYEELLAGSMLGGGMLGGGGGIDLKVELCLLHNILDMKNSNNNALKDHSSRFVECVGGWRKKISMIVKRKGKDVEENITIGKFQLKMNIEDFWTGKAMKDFSKKRMKSDITLYEISPIIILRKSIEKNNLELVKELIGPKYKVNVNEFFISIKSEVTKKNILIYCVENERLEIAEYLLKNGFSKPDSLGDVTLIRNILFTKKNNEMLLWLIERLPDVNIEMTNRYYLIHYMAQEIIQVGTLSTLIERGVDIKKRDGNWGTTLLHHLFAFAKMDNPETELKIQLLKKHLEEDEFESEKLVGESVKYYSSKNYEKCIEILEKAIERYPRNVLSYLKMGETYKLLKNVEKSIESYEKAIEIDEKLILGYVQIACLYEFNLNDKEKSISYYTKAVAIEPPNDHSYIALINLASWFAYYKEDLDIAEKYIRKAIEVKKGTTSHLCFFAMFLYFRRKSYQQSIEYAGKVIEENNFEEVLVYSKESSHHYDETLRTLIGDKKEIRIINTSMCYYLKIMSLLKNVGANNSIKLLEIVFVKFAKFLEELITKGKTDHLESTLALFNVVKTRLEAIFQNN